MAPSSKSVELSNLYVPGFSNLHLPSQSVFGEVGLTGTPDEQVGAESVQAMFAAVLALSVNTTSPPAAIVTRLAGDAEPEVAQHGQSGSTQFSLTSSFASDAPAASAGTIATAAPNTAATGR